MGLIPEWYDENISTAILWGPCTNPDLGSMSDVYSEEIWNYLIENEIWVIGGPNWDRDVAKIMNDGPELLK